MKKKIIMGLCALLLMTGMVSVPKTVVNAEETISVDGSELLHEDQAIGYARNMTRGVYLMSGDSSISKAGSNSVYANGSTTARQTVSTVSVTVILEKSTGGSWSRVTSWSAENYNSAYVSSTKAISVGSGYYYRVRSIHYANSDTSSSYTNGIYI